MGTGKTLSVTAYTVNDGDGGADYNVTSATNSDGKIAPAPLSVSGVSAENKDYDGTTAATLDFNNAELVGVFSGDTATLDTGGATGTFASPGVGDEIAVTVSGLTLGGPQASDYSLTQPSTTASIQPATPKISWPGPTAITYGTDLSGDQLDATASIAGSPLSGTFQYTPAAGAVLNAGKSQALSVTFTPTDSTDYTKAIGSTTIVVEPATPALTVTDPGGAFDGRPYPASVSTAGVGDVAPAASLEDVVPTLTYFLGQGTSGASLGASPPLTPGTYTVVASFPGSADYAATRAAPLTFTIGKASVQSASISPSSESAAYGQPITFLATIDGGPVAPSGTVTFYDGPNPLGTVAVDASGQAALTTSSLSVGVHSISAAYSGDADLLAATWEGPSESVTRAATKVVLVSQPVLRKKRIISMGLKAEVQPTPPGAGIPTGTVTFEIQKKSRKKVTEKVLGTMTLSDGSASLMEKPKQVLKKPITIIYTGDSDFHPITAPPTILTKPRL